MITYIASDNTDLQTLINEAARTASEEHRAEITLSAGHRVDGAADSYSHMTLTLEEGATIRFYCRPAALPAGLDTLGGIECAALHPLLYAADACTLPRGGVIEGAGQWVVGYVPSGLKRRTVRRRGKLERSQLAALNPELSFSPRRRRASSDLFLRPPLVQFWKCSAIHLQDHLAELTVLDPAYRLFP